MVASVADQPLDLLPLDLPPLPLPLIFLRRISTPTLGFIMASPFPAQKAGRDRELLNRASGRTHGHGPTV